MKEFLFLLLLIIFICVINSSILSKEKCDEEEEKASVEVTKVGISLQQEGNHTEALKFFDQALKICYHPKILYFKAISLKALWNLKGAKEIFEKILYDSRVVKYHKQIRSALKEIEILLQPIYVVVSSGEKKGAKVYINNKFRGLTPVTELVARGPCTIKIESPGYLSIIKDIEVGMENPLHIDVSFKLLDSVPPQTISRSSIDEKIAGKLIYEKLVRKKVKKWSKEKKIFFWSGMAVFAGGIPFFVRHMLDLKNFERETKFKESDKLPYTNLIIGISAMSTGAVLFITSFFFENEEEKRPLSTIGFLPEKKFFLFDFSIPF